MKYRSRTDITAQILEIANGGTTKTRIMYGAYLSYAQVKEYLAVLIENGLLEHIQSEQKFKTTSKGIKFLRTMNEMSKLTGSMTTANEIRE